jgi:hypothetical protein
MAQRLSGIDPIRQRLNEPPPPNQQAGRHGTDPITPPVTPPITQIDPVGYSPPESGPELLRAGLWAGLGFAVASLVVNAGSKRFKFLR